MRVTWGVAAGSIVSAIVGAAVNMIAACGPAGASSPVKLDGGWKAKILKTREVGRKPASGSLYQPVTFAELPGWSHDDHLAAFQTFLKSCDRLLAGARERRSRAQLSPAGLLAVCGQGNREAGRIRTKEQARAFFEANFTPAAVRSNGRSGLLTGYYEPVLKGSRTPQGPYQTPIYKRPPELITVISETHRGAVKAGAFTHLRKTDKGPEPYFTRAQIDQGALKGRGLELLYLSDSVDIFFMQIQGSGRIQLTDGSMIRVQYDGKNGHPYRSIGRYLIDKALLAADKVSLDSLATWLKSDRQRANQVMWHNTSYVFFRELKGEEAGAPLGALNVPLTAGRSLAIDPRHHALGSPIYVSAPGITHVPGSKQFHRLMIGQDVGSAIKGPERGDIYFGSGDAAGKVAGITKHPGNFFVLLPKNGSAPAEVSPSQAAGQKIKQ